jgi:hypothetical protein
MNKVTRAKEYLRVLWKQDDPETPVEMLYEVNDDRAVPRMVEIFADGRATYNTLARESERYPRFTGRSLVDGDMPTLAEARALSAGSHELETNHCTEQDFETAFQRAVHEEETASSGENP